MQTQAVPDAPTFRGVDGYEAFAARDSGQFGSEEDGDVVSVTGSQVTRKLQKANCAIIRSQYERSKQSTCSDQRPAVTKGRHSQAYRAGDSSSTVDGKLALGQMCGGGSWKAVT